MLKYPISYKKQRTKIFLKQPHERSIMQLKKLFSIISLHLFTFVSLFSMDRESNKEKRAFHETEKVARKMLKLSLPSSSSSSQEFLSIRTCDGQTTNLPEEIVSQLEYLVGIKKIFGCKQTFPLENVTQQDLGILIPLLESRHKKDRTNFDNILQTKKLSELLTILRTSDYLLLDDNPEVYPFDITKTVIKQTTRKLSSDKSLEKFLSDPHFFPNSDQRQIPHPLARILATTLLSSNPRIKQQIFSRCPFSSIQLKTATQTLVTEFNPTDKQLVTLNKESETTWDSTTGKQLQTLKNRVLISVFKKTDEQMVSLAQDGTVNLWSTDSIKTLLKLNNNPGIRWGMISEHTTDKIVGFCEDNTVRVWSIENGACLYTLDGFDKFKRATFDPSSTKLAIASANTISVYDAQTGEPLLKLTDQYHSQTNHLEFNSDGSSLLIARSNESTILWNIQKNTKKVFYLDKGPRFVCNIKYRAHLDQSENMIVENDGEEVRLWNIKSRECRRLENSYGCADVQFNRDGTLVLATFRKGIMTIWDVKSGEMLEIHLNEEKKELCCAEFNNKGNQVVIGFRDKTTKIWTLDRILKLKDYLQQKVTLPQALLAVAWHKRLYQNIDKSLPHIQSIYDSIGNKHLKELLATTKTP